MNKTQIKKHINKSVYEFVTEMGYLISDDNDGSSVTFSKPDCKSYDDTIEYHRSVQDTCVLNWASDEVKADAEKIDEYIKAVKADIEWKVKMENGDVE
jgi:hypothetical protein